MVQHELYQTFVAIYRAGSISGAAKLRHLTQPAVSQQLAALETLVGTSLFQRTPKGAIPTRRGQALYAQVFDALDRLERVSRSLRRSSTINEPSTICLGAPPEYFYTFALERLRGVTFDMQIRVVVERRMSWYTGSSVSDEKGLTPWKRPRRSAASAGMRP
jgi:DNA-binding transcriptional LysR family regulator